MADGNIDVDTFTSLHQQQFQSIGLPNNLWEVLYGKIFPEKVHDTENAFELRKIERKDFGKWSLHAKKDLGRESNVFLIEHVWTSDGGAQAQKKLQKDAKMYLRIKDMLLEEEEEDNGDYLDKNEVVAQLSSVDTNVASDALKHTKGDLIDAVSIINDGKIDVSREDVMKEMVEDKMKSKSLSFDEFKVGFLEESKNKDVSDEYIKKLYQNYLKESNYESGGKDNEEKNGGTTLQYTWTEDIEGTITIYVTIPVKCKKADIVSKITVRGWEFGVKGSPPVIKGEFYSRVHPDECFWTFDSPGLMQVLIQKEDEEVSWPVLIKGEEQLSTRNIAAKAHERDEETIYQIEQVLETMWRYNQTYQAVISSSGVQESVWYIMDEYGTAITHSTQPNIRCMPFACVTTGIFYSLIWPIRDIKRDEICSRNACPQMHTETALQHQARMLAFEEDLPERCPLQFILSSVDLEKASENSTPATVSVHPLSEDCANKLDGDVKDLKFYTDVHMDFFVTSLKVLGCSLVSSPEEADVLWVSSESTALGKLRDQKVNRLRGEENLLKKNILSYLIRMTLGKPSWYPPTYDLKSQLAVLVSDHYERGIDNFWIVKSFNQKMNNFKPIVTSNLTRLCRLSEMPPLVASHFKSICAMYNLKRRFCLQFCVIIASLNPIQIVIHNTPSIKLAEKEVDPFMKLEEYNSPAHVAVAQDKSLREVGIDDLLENLNKNYLLKLKLTWEDVRKNIAKAIGELFSAVCPTLSCYHSSCAVYGIDVLLSGDLEPVIIGIDEIPDFANQETLIDVLQMCVSTCESKEKLRCAENFTKVIV